MVSRVSGVTTPLGEDKAPVSELAAARQMLESESSLSYDARFIEVEEGVVVADRAFNAARKAAAQPGASPLEDYSVQWDPNNPNVLTVSCMGGVVSMVDPRLHTLTGQQSAHFTHDTPLRSTEHRRHPPTRHVSVCPRATGTGGRLGLGS